MTASALLRTIALPALLAIATPSASAIDFERTITTGSSPNVTIGTGFGYIHIAPGAGTQVHIIGHVHAEPGWAAFMSIDGPDLNIISRLTQIAAAPPVVNVGNTVTIGAAHNYSVLFRRVAIDYDITLPPASTITAVTGSGLITVLNVGASLKALSGLGSITALGIQGAADLTTTSGQIQLIQTGPGEVHVKTGSGPINLTGITGSLTARTASGAINIIGKPASGWNINAGSGSISLNVGNTSFTLNAGTSSGGIRVDQPFTMQANFNRYHLAATVNGGGPSVNVSTGSGDIHIH